MIPASLSGPAIEYQILEHSPLLDSSNMTMDDWSQIATELDCYYDDFDGFVIIHGTDTLAYTASALSFMLEGLVKPVVLTGSQIPFSELRSDASDNLLGALLIAAHFGSVVREVVVYFGSKLMRGNRVSKVSNEAIDAFDSLNYPVLGHAGVKIKVKSELLLRVTSQSISRLQVHTRLDPNVAILRIFPGMSTSAFRAMLAAPLRGLVLLTFGSGNMPTNRPDLLSILEEAVVERGVVAVNVSQCVKGMVPPSALYATGRHLERIGVVSGSDMTVECALAKVSFLLGTGMSGEEIRWHLGQSMRGELTPHH
jgi:lysophospholipase